MTQKMIVAGLSTWVLGLLLLAGALREGFDSASRVELQVAVATIGGGLVLALTGRGLQSLRRARRLGHGRTSKSPSPYLQG